MRFLQILALLFVAIGLLTTSCTAQYWQAVTLPAQAATNYWLDVFFLPSNPQLGWACGFRSQVVRTTDGGNTWQLSTVMNNSGGHLESVHFVDSQNGYASGPAGVFKSTDGGATWSVITPSMPFGVNPWGCYFLNSQVGVTIGGGCISRQYFFKTTDGGSTWTTFSDSIGASGMTDLILYPNGTGCAIGSGAVWTTNDSGSTWQSNTSTPNPVWHEELAKNGASILIPMAGNTCQGGGGGGGALFSTNDGVSWNTFNAGAAFYGAFLLSANKGWACGNSRSMYYTENAGATWTLYNCGITGDVDDTWWINDTTGFVVGNAIYKYSPAFRFSSKKGVQVSLLDFNSVCPPDSKLDTFWVHNKSWTSINAQWDVTGADASQYSVLQPFSKNIVVPACDSVLFIVRFQPSSSGTKNAQIPITFPSVNQSISVALQGNGKSRNAFVVDTLIIANNTPVGSTRTSLLEWRNNGNETETIVAIQRVSGSNDISISTLPPIDIPPNGKISTQFAYALTDTGWHEARYRFTLAPCMRDTFVTVRVYGKSPIIHSTPTRQSYLQCTGFYLDTIPVWNSGNDALVISSYSITNGSSFSIVGWADGGTMPYTIPIGERRFLIVRITPGAGVSLSARLSLYNNDLTTKEGVKNPLEITLNATVQAPLFRVNRKVIDFGEVCLGTVRDSAFELSNFGTIEGSVAKRGFATSTFSLLGVDFPQRIIPLDKRVPLVRFSPTTNGEFIDTLFLTYNPCNDSTMLIVKGKAVSSSIASTPSNISAVLKSGTTSSRNVTVTSQGEDTATVTQVILRPARTDWRLKDVPSLPFVMKKDSAITIQIEFSPTADTSFVGEICFISEKKCPSQTCVQIQAQSTNKSVNISTAISTIGLCSTPQMFDTVWVYNKGSQPEEITSVTIDNTPAWISIQQPTSFPQIVTDSLPIVFANNKSTEGTETATINIKIASIINPFVTTITRTVRKALPELRTSAEWNIGTLELCQTATPFAVSIENVGLLDDELQIERKNPDARISIENSLATLSIPSKQTGKTLLLYTPKTVGIIDEYITFKGICNVAITVHVVGTIIKPKLTVNPPSIQHPRILREKYAYDTITISNPTRYARRVRSVVLQNVAQNFVLPIPFTPIVLQPDSTVRVPVEFMSPVSGDFLSSVQIIEGEVCFDTTTVTLASNVPEIIYRATLQAHAPNRIIDVGDIDTLAFTLTTNDQAEDALFKCNPQSIATDIVYNKAVLHVLSCFTKYTGAIQQLPLDEGANGFSVKIPLQQGNILGKTDTLFYSVVQSLSGIEHSTFVTPANVLVETNKPYQIDTIPDVYKSAQCFGYTLTEREFFTSQLQKNPASESINISIDANVAQELSFTLLDQFGREVLQSNTHIQQGNANLRIPANAIASGMYILSIRNSHGVQRMHNLIIAK